MATHRSAIKVVRGACPQDCPDTCAFLYHVEDGKLVEVTGDPDHPMTRGGLCVKLKNYAEHHYNPDRLLHPMKRLGPKGSGKFKQITYDEALGEIKKRWTDIICFRLQPGYRNLECKRTNRCRRYVYGDWPFHRKL